MPPTIPSYPPMVEDVSGCESVAQVDIAQLYAKLSSPELKDEDAHIINIVTKQPLTIGQFKQMFYSRGDDDFSIANCYQNPKNIASIYNSPWGISDPSSIYLYNYNRLGGRDNNPEGTFMAYAYESDRQKTFLAQVDVLANMENDLCEKRDEWTMCSRAGIFDSVFNLTFAREKYSSPCLQTHCARSWSEMEDALNEDLLCKNTHLTVGDYIDFFINIKLDNCHESIKPNIIRIRYIVKVTDGWVDFVNWGALSQFYHNDTNVPIGNTKTLLTQLSTPLFKNCEFKWNEGNTDLSGSQVVWERWWQDLDVSKNQWPGGFLMRDTSNSPYITENFDNSGIDHIALSSIQPNGTQAFTNWISYYFKPGRSYLFERSINGFPNNYMKIRLNTDPIYLYDGSGAVSELQWVTWLEGAGSYEVAPSLLVRGTDASYCLNIYDLPHHHSCAFPGVPGDFPEGGSAQYSNASQIPLYNQYSQNLNNATPTYMKTAASAPPHWRPPPGFIVSKTTASVSEAGTTDSFTVVLTTRPNNLVNLSIDNPDTSEIAISPSNLTFTMNNWNVPQTVIITGVNDPYDDDHQTTILTISVLDNYSDHYFKDVPDQTVTVTTIDNDAAGFTLSKTTAAVSEIGSTDIVYINLTVQPFTNVVLSIISADTSEVTVNPSSLTFTTANWATPQPVTLTGVNDSLADGNQTVLVTVSVVDAQSSDEYDSVANQTITVVNTDIPPCSAGMDVAFIIDITSSMGSEINTVKSGASSIANQIEILSSTNYRLTLVTVSEKPDTSAEPYASTATYINLPANQKVNEEGLITPFENPADTTPNWSWTTCLEVFSSNNKSSWDANLQLLNTAAFPLASNSGSKPEPTGIAWDEVMNGRQGRPPIGGSFLASSHKIIIILTDAPPGGQDNYWNHPGSSTPSPPDDDYARWHDLRDQAVAQGIKISVVYINSSSAYHDSDAQALYENVCTATNGIFSDNLNGSFHTDIINMLNSMCS